MSGFWTTTPDGHTIHINGDPQMSKETRFALSVMLDAFAKQFERCAHEHLEAIYTTHYGPHYSFVVERSVECGEVTVKIWGNDGSDKPVYLGVLPTRIAHYATNKPSAGWAYYWRFDGLSHSTPPIAPAPAEGI